jgi:hypothetical protein
MNLKMNLMNQPLTHSFKPLSLGVLVVLSLAASLLSAATIDDLEFTLINGDTEYSVKAKDPLSIEGAVDIPATYNRKPVTEIGRLGFGVADDATVLPELLTSVNIPASIKVIEYEAFDKYPSLKTVNFAPNSELTTVGDYLFAICTSLQSISLPDSLTYLSRGMFQYCSALASVDLPQALITIEGGAFYRRKLNSIVIPEGVTSLGHYTFNYCLDLTSVTFLGAAPETSPSGFYRIVSEDSP